MFAGLPTVRKGVQKGEQGTGTGNPAAAYLRALQSARVCRVSLSVFLYVCLCLISSHLLVTAFREQ
jgi:hypothetical protein